MSSKAEIRKVIKQKQSALSSQDVLNYSQLVLENLKHYLLKPSGNVHIYESLPALNEPVTTSTIGWLKSNGGAASIFVPSYTQKNKPKKIDPEQIISYNRQIVPGNRTMRLSDAIDLFIVPVVAFDNKGTRLGHGGGFYDMLLAKYPNARKVGLAFEIQNVDAIPSEPHDIALEAVVTEKRVYNFEDQSI